MSERFAGRGRNGRAGRGTRRWGRRWGRIGPGDAVNIDTHVGLVEGVRQLDGVARPGVEVDLVLRDELGAVKVVLLRNESLGLDEDVGVRVGDPGTNFA